MIALSGPWPAPLPRAAWEAAVHVLPRLTPVSTTSDQLWAVATMGLAVLAVLLAVVQTYEIGALVALIAIGTGGWSQLVSQNRSERFETVSAVIVAVVALAVCVGGADFPSWF